MKRSIPLLGLAFLLIILIADAHTSPKKAYFTVSVPPQEFKALKVRNLPKDAHIGVEVESSHAITIAFVDSAGYRQLPRPQKPLMAGKVDRRLNFSVVIPETGHYYVVLVNPDPQSPAEVELTVKAARSATDQLDAANQILELFERQMHKLFVFETFPVGVESCGRQLAFYGTDGFFLCGEYVRLIYSKVQDRPLAVKILTFSIFHELALELMEQWEIPAKRSLRQTADELAVVMMVMLNQEAKLEELGRYFVANPDVAAAFKDELIDDWHPLSVARAQKLLSWLDDPDMVRSWQARLIPHMQTELLQWLQKNPTPWSVTALVEMELAKRRQESPSPMDKENTGDAAEI